MAKQVRIVMTGHGRGEVFIDGKKIEGVTSVDFSAAIAVQTVDAVQAQAFISFLTDSRNAPVWRSNGLALGGH